MGVHIDHIRVNRGGPLDRDFEMRPEGVNLIYGPNETGKTYLVETIIALLFHTGRSAEAEWDLRKWRMGGRISVSGLEENAVEFNIDGRKLEDFWQDQIGLPPQLSRLLVVKANEPRLYETASDGVGPKLLKNYLSGEGLIDSIEGRISKTLERATLDSGEVVGDDRGELRARNQHYSRLGSLNALIDNVDRDESLTRLQDLETRLTNLQTEIDLFDRAKRYRAATLDSKRRGLQTDLDGLPEEDELRGLQQDIARHRELSFQAAEVESRVDELQGFADSCEWAERALSLYPGLMSASTDSGDAKTFGIWSAVTGIGAIVSGSGGFTIGLVGLGIISMMLGIFCYRAFVKALATKGVREELDEIRTEYKRRFDSELTDRSTLQSRVDRLKEKLTEARTWKDQLDGFRSDANRLHGTIQSRLREIDEERALLAEDQWDHAVKEALSDIKKHERELSETESALAHLRVEERDYLAESPGEQWSAQRAEDLRSRWDAADGERSGLESELGKLRARVQQETRSQEDEWSALISALHQTRADVAKQYREKTAEILAKILLKNALADFRDRENERIEKALRKDALLKPLLALKSDYVRFRQGSDGEILVITTRDESFPLGDLSTGAQEQVFLALRVGFASIAMQGASAFLILDDAFQHSDWERRETLVECVMDLTTDGWQVLYFTMDDHMRDLFVDAAEQRSIVLGYHALGGNDAP